VGRSGGWSSRERVMTALNPEEPDRVPIFVTITPQVTERLSRHLGIPEYSHPDSPLAENRISYAELLTALGNDIVAIGACSPADNPAREIGGGLYTNEWGITYRRSGYYTEMVDYPLAHAETVADVQAYPMPDPKAPGRFDHAARMVETYGREYAICGDA